MQNIVSCAVMRRADAAEIARGTSGTVLMQRAGAGIYAALRRRRNWGKTAVVCGAGNNAGDGFVLAQCIRSGGETPVIFLLSERFSADGKYFFDECVRSGIRWEYFDEETVFSAFDTVADCIFGTGFHGEPDARTAACIRKINESGKFVVSADINSGLSGDGGTGEICVRSDLTVSIGCRKAGTLLGRAKDVVGAHECVDIGIPIVEKCFLLPENGDFHDLLRIRPYHCHKGTYGATAILGGCTEYAGAAKLANLACAALKSGCGLTKLAVPASVAPAVAPYLLESTLFPFPDENGHMRDDTQALDALTRGTRAVACGMGWGKSAPCAALLRALLASYSETLIIDADAINLLAVFPEGAAPALRDAVCRAVILTPHPLEFSRLSGFSMEEIERDPIACTQSFRARAGEKIILLLKGTVTVVAGKDDVYLVNRGCPGMATAGSGDVLSGVLAGLMGYCAPTEKAVACGAYLAGLAGELAERDVGSSIAMTASDTAAHLPEAVRILVHTPAATDKTEDSKDAEVGL